MAAHHIRHEDEAVLNDPNIFSVNDPTRVELWYPLLRDHTFETQFMDVTIEEVWPYLTTMP